MMDLGPSRFSSSELVIVPGIISVFDRGDDGVLGIRLRYTVNLNTSSVGALPDGNLDINELSHVIHCIRDIITDRNRTTLAAVGDGNGDTVGFMRSGTLYVIGEVAVFPCVPFFLEYL